LKKKKKIQQQNIKDYINRMFFHSNNIPLLLLLTVHLLAFERCRTTGQTELGLQTGILYTSQEPNQILHFWCPWEDGAVEGERDYFSSCESSE
jgi:hypothetical protein